MDRDIIAAGIVDRLVAGDGAPMAAPAVKALPVASGWGGVGWSYAGPNVSAYDFRRHDLSANSVIALALKWIRRNIHLGRIVVGIETDEGTDEAVNGHPLTALLRRPNRVEAERRAVMSWKALLGATADSIALRGCAYWLKARNLLTDEVEEVYWAPNGTITIDPEPDPARQAVSGPIRRYWYTAGSYRREYLPRDVVHFRDGADPACPYRGLNDLLKQARNAAAVDFGERFTVASLRNGHGGKVLAPKESGASIQDGHPDQKEMFGLAQEIEGGLSGENVGRVIKTSLPVDLIDLGLGPEEMALLDILDRPTSMILAALGLNGVVLGIPSRDQSTYENKKQAREDALRFGVVPIQDLIAEEIEAQLLPDFADAEPAATRVWWDRADVPDLQQDPDAAATRAQVLFTSGLLPRDRALQAGGMEPVGGEEGELYSGQQTEADAEAAAQAERIAAGKDQNEDDEQDDDGGQDDDEDEPSARTVKSLGTDDPDDLEEVLPDHIFELDWTGYVKTLLDEPDLIVYEDAAGAIKRYNPGQARDARGRWTSGAGAGGGKHAARNARRRAKRKAKHPPRSRRANGRGTVASRKKLADQIRAARASVNTVSPEPHSSGRRALLARVRELRGERATAKRLRWELRPKGGAVKPKPEPAAKPPKVAAPKSRPKPEPRPPSPKVPVPRAVKPPPAGRTFTAPGQDITAELAGRRAADDWAVKGWKSWADDLPDGQRKIFKAYKTEAYTEINEHLRGIKPNPHISGAIAKLDAGIASGRVPEAVTVYRGVRDAQAMGLGDPARAAGIVIHENAFMSTSMDIGSSKEFTRTAQDVKGKAGAIFRFTIPRGTPAAHLDSVPDLRALGLRESELLLGRGYRLRVTGHGGDHNGSPIYDAILEAP